MYEINPAISIKDKETITVMDGGSLGENPSPHDITIKHILDHYRDEAPSMKSIRNIGPIVGDWRPMADLAQELLEIFKRLNWDKLTEMCEDYPMDLRGDQPEILEIEDFIAY